MTDAAKVTDLVEETILDDSDTTYNFNELYAAIMEHRDIILTIPEDQLSLLKQGLSVKKSKENAKLKNAGLAVPTDSFTYLSYHDEEEASKESGNIKVRIKLGPRTNVTVIRMELPDDRL